MEFNVLNWNNIFIKICSLFDQPFYVSIHFDRWMNMEIFWKCYMVTLAAMLLDLWFPDMKEIEPMVLKVTQCNIWTNVENDKLHDPCSFGSQFINRHIKA